MDVIFTVITNAMRFSLTLLSYYSQAGVAFFQRVLSTGLDLRTFGSLVFTH